MANSVYNTTLHVSVPTLSFIKDYTSLDLVLEEGNKERAEAKVLSLTAKAKDFLYINKSPYIQNIISYLIFKYDAWTKAWESYVLKYIEATFYFGDESQWEKTPRTVLNAIDGSILAARDFTQAIKTEVTNSEEEW